MLAGAGISGFAGPHPRKPLTRKNEWACSLGVVVGGFLRRAFCACVSAIRRSSRNPGALGGLFGHCVGAWPPGRCPSRNFWGLVCVFLFLGTPTRLSWFVWDMLRI